MDGRTGTGGILKGQTLFKTGRYRKLRRPMIVYVMNWHGTQKDGFNWECVWLWKSKGTPPQNNAKCNNIFCVINLIFFFFSENALSQDRFTGINPNNLSRSLLHFSLFSFALLPPFSLRFRFLFFFILLSFLIYSRIISTWHLSFSRQDWSVMHFLPWRNSSFFRFIFFPFIFLICHSLVFLS